MKHNKNTILVIFISMMAVFAISCGSGDLPTPGGGTPSELNHRCLGVWEVEFDIEHHQIDVIKQTNKDYPVDSWLSAPKFEYIDYDFATNIIDVNVVVENSFIADAWDPRMIFYTDGSNNMVQDYDHLTALYDIPGGEVFNPFKLFCKDEPDRIFKGKTVYTENMQILLPDGEPIPKILIGFEATQHQHCVEPYAFANFKPGVVYPQKGSSGFYEIDVFDWQDNVMSVAIYCPEITGRAYESFTNTVENTWSVDLVNYTEAPIGEYQAIIMAGSDDAGPLVLADIVTITIHQDLSPPRWVATEGLINATAGNQIVNLYWGMATDYESPQPIRYLVYVDLDDYPWDQIPIERNWHDPFTYAGLTNGITYYFGVRCRDTADPPNIDTNTVVLAQTPKE